MNNNEKDINEAQNQNEVKSMQIVESETQQSELQVLSKMFEQDENQPESLLTTSARRLSNLAHSLMESREKAYLESDSMYPTISSCAIDDIVKLSMAANEQMKTALAFKREKIQAIKTLKEKS